MLEIPILGNVVVSAMIMKLDQARKCKNKTKTNSEICVKHAALSRQMKQASLASLLSVIVVCVDISLYVQFLIKFETVTTAKPLQSHFTLVK